MKNKGRNCPGSNDLRGALILRRGVIFALLFFLPGCIQIDAESLVRAITEKQLSAQKEIQELRERVKRYEEMPAVFLIPQPSSQFNQFEYK